MADVSIAEVIAWKYGAVADTVDGRITRWKHPSQAQPDEVQLAADRAEYVAFLASTLFQKKRAPEYPPIFDYVDAQVKKSSNDPAVQADGVAQEQAYFAACLAVKAKYPKPKV